MKKILLAGVLSLFFCKVNAQYIQGHISDLTTGKPIQNVWVKSETDSVLSDTSGKYILPYTSGKITFSLEGYEIESRIITKNDLQTFLYIRLIPTEVDLKMARVSAVRAGKNVPATFTNLEKKELAEKDNGKDVPYILQHTTGVVSFSDAGAGIGYSGLRIRGVDQTRINVTLNGVPVNDAESQGVFWVDLPDLNASVDKVQIQRGIGTSTNGPASFGASINMVTDQLPEQSFAQAVSGGGSFGTVRQNIYLGTGNLTGGWNFTGRLSLIESQGFIDRASSQLRSWNLSGSKAFKKGRLYATVLHGNERTYQAWNGVPLIKFANSSQGFENYLHTISTEKNADNALNAYIQLLYLDSSDAGHLKNSSPSTYNGYRYKNQVDVYAQSYYQAFYQTSIKPNIGLNAGLFYTRGNGYYEEYRKNESFSSYGLPDFQISDTIIQSADLVRRRWLDNHNYGLLYTLKLLQKNIEWTFGGSASSYNGWHFGQIIWSEFLSDIAPETEYYRNKAIKSEAQQYVKINFNRRKWYYYGDLQVRGLRYAFNGPDNNLQLTDREVTYIFLNPKAGFTFQAKPGNQYYFSAAMANREPVREDFIQSTPKSEPKPEQLYNAECGFKAQRSNLSYQLNGFLMYYLNQLILTGELNDVGAYTRTNIDRSYRIGIEASAQFKWSNRFLWTGNIHLSKNKIPVFKEFVDDWDQWGTQQTFEYKNTNISFSPQVVASSAFTWASEKGMGITLIGKYVSRQYLDNTSSKIRSLEPFVVPDIDVFYRPVRKKTSQKRPVIDARISICNVLNKAYAPNGYSFSGIISGTRTDFVHVYPQAGTHFLCRLALTF